MRLALYASAALLLAAGPVFAAAPAPAKPVEVQRFYQGTWYEIARTPFWLTNGCPAGATAYELRGDGEVNVTNSCHDHDPAGKLKTLKGRGRFIKGDTAKLHVQYNLVIGKDYWILDHADDYSWMIDATPSLGELWIYTRTPQPSAELKTALTDRARALGYDVTKLEWPEQPAS